MLLKLENPDLTHDPHACRVEKDEVVAVEFAVAAGLLHSAVGPNRYAAGDALLTGSTGDRWCVSRARFDAKYRPEPGTAAGRAGSYRNIPIAIRAKRIAEPFCVARSAGGDVLRGNAGDWLVEYAPGDHGIVAADRFDSVYRIIGGDGA
jgi:uncharacterized protein (DUF2237 family)